MSHYHNGETSKLLADGQNSYQSARTAYDIADSTLSREIHDARVPEHLEDLHSENGGYLKAIVFGGLDGILTSFAIVAGSEGGGLAWTVILTLGFSNVVADAISMGVGEFLSSKAHRDFVLTEKQREQWEYNNYKDGEIKEMVMLFSQRGMGREDAEIVVKKMAEYEQFFINLMVTEELGLQLPEEDDTSLLKDAVVMFLSFTSFGALPLVAYCFGPLQWFDDEHLFILSLACTGIALFLLGAVKALFSSAHWFYSGMETFLLGATCAGVAYGIGAAVGEFVAA